MLQVKCQLLGRLGWSWGTSHLRVEGAIVHRHGIADSLIMVAALATSPCQHGDAFIGFVVLVVEHVELSCVHLLLVNRRVHLDLLP